MTFIMTNSELAAAIEVAHQKLHTTARCQSYHATWEGHLSALLHEQQKRATLCIAPADEGKHGS